MLYHLLYPLHSEHSVFNVFRYITFRSLMAAMTSLAISFLLGPWLIRRLTEHQIGQVVRSDGPERHLIKAGTPTMGGTLILFSLILATLLLADLTNTYVWLVIVVTLGFAVIGFLDDYRKLVQKNSAGLSGRQKLMGQFALAFAAAIFLYFKPGFTTTVSFPFFKDLHPDFGVFYIPFAAVFVVGFSNAVNLTDGLDGLAIGPVMTTAGAYVVFAYVAGNVKNAEYLQIPYVAGAGELAIFCAAVVAAGLGFLWFNAYPAMMFMGDVGALPLGAALGIVALLTKQELVLVLAGGIFVVEALSVMLQVGSYKLRRKRIFRMAPIHHHFELQGWPEPQIIVRFWIVSAICAIAALSTLKLR
ncbi:MAG: phospho-N-acetylmuramoyl-pentapeptide-transferase [Deltaproteobacteria bacterium]|nr:phospho-N-acetylmuramoyl-pentapeptide-transferase [Deltaproteobacteria bacterium]MBI3386863.1 phospho-N-acetylmuramoyl-pentapeptide-transferase [Deltaproteobacteria bacterium]